MTDNDRMAAMRQLMERMQSGGEVTLPGGVEAHVEQDREDGVAMSMNLGGMGFRLFEASAQRPEAYPIELPFIPNAAVAVGEMGAGAISMHWWNPPERLMQEVVRRSLEHGWTKDANEDSGSDFGRKVELRRDGRTRTIMGTRPVVTLIERAD